MSITVNGEQRETEAATLGDYLQELGLHARLVVVEQNGEIVSRDQYPQTPVCEGDAIEIVQMMAGG